MNRSATLGELRGLLDIASDDELAAFAVIARRVMGGGRVQYGPLDLATDKRNFAKEAADEAADLLWYAAIREVQAGYATHKYRCEHNKTNYAHYMCTPCYEASLDSAPPSESINEFASAGGGATVYHGDGECDDCGAQAGEPHAYDCEWVLVVPPSGSEVGR